jgi:WD40 repeat protein
MVTTRQVGEPLRGHEAPVHTVATARLDDRPIAVTGGWDHTLRIWDLRSGRRLGSVIRPGHQDLRWAMTTGTLGRRTIAVTGGADGRVRVWDLAAREQIGPDLVFPGAVRALAMTPGERLVVGFDREVAVLEPR